jgi:hypothetical protein
MELITKLSKMYDTMKRNGFVMCAKSSAEEFLTLCVMLETVVTFQLVGNKVKFEIK